MGARLAPTSGRVNQSPVYCLRLRLTRGEWPPPWKVVAPEHLEVPTDPVLVFGPTALMTTFQSSSALRCSVVMPDGPAAFPLIASSYSSMLVGLIGPSTALSFCSICFSIIALSIAPVTEFVSFHVYEAYAMIGKH